MHVRAHEWGIYKNGPYYYPIAIFKVRYGELWGARSGYTLKIQKMYNTNEKCSADPGFDLTTPKESLLMPNALPTDPGCQYKVT